MLQRLLLRHWPLQGLWLYWLRLQLQLGRRLLLLAWRLLLLPHLLTR